MKLKSLLKNKIFKIVVIVVVIVGLVFLLIPKEQPKVEPIIPNVKVMEVLTSSNQEQMKFVGFIQPKETFQGTFGTIGTIDQVNVTPGQQVKKGALLMSVDDESARISLTNAQESYGAALSNQKQAKSLMDAEAKNLMNENKMRDDQIVAAQAEIVTLDQFIVDKQAEIDALEADETDQSEAIITAQAELVSFQTQKETAKGALANLQSESPASIDIATSRYEAAVAAHDAAKAQTSIANNNVQQAQDMVDETRLISAIDGTVVAVVQSVGELATPLIPSVVVASYDKVAVFGLSQTNVNLVEVDMIAKITAQGKELEGTVSDISLVPDTTSRTYEAKISVGTQEELNIGETVQIVIDIKKTEGIWLNINLLLNNGQDYVYVVTDGRINKRIVEKIGMQNDMVLLKNLQAGDQVVIEGFKSLKIGDKVTILGENNE
jgi:multidrug efflux pump subunit AcrA (membrane-fusion protein)